MRKKRLWGVILALVLAVSGCGQSAAETGNDAQIPMSSLGEQTSPGDQQSPENQTSSGDQQSPESQASSGDRQSPEGQASSGDQQSSGTEVLSEEHQTSDGHVALRETPDINELYEKRPVSLKQMEALDRGFVAVTSAEGIFLSWRFLGTDAETLAFNIYKNGSLLNQEPVADVTSYLDKGAEAGASYTLVPVQDGRELTEETEEAISFGEYLSVPVKQYEVGDYDIFDASVGDLDGDGQYEIVVRRNPADMNYQTRVAYPLLEAYELDGTHMWTINIGPNEINYVDLNFIVYDLNGDGKAEVVMRSFEGTTDGTGNQIGDVNGDGKTDYSKDNVVVMKDRSYLSEGPEFLSMYDGQTGAELARTDLLPTREPLNSWYGADRGKQVKRASHYLFCVAYLNGETPSLVHFRGAWATCKAAAYDIVDGQFQVRFTIDCDCKDELDNIYNAGYHSIAVADVDYDGKDEIINGAMAIDDDGTVMYTVKAAKENGKMYKLGHGDAFDVAVMNPDTPAYYVWACRETANLPVNIGLHDALTGEVLFGQTKPKDTGRSRAADIDPTSRGWEMWGSTNTPLQSVAGEVLCETCPSSMNMKMYWDGDLLAELVDHDSSSAMNIYKWDWENKQLNTVLKAEGSASNGGSKGQTCLIADIFGDWREELVVRTADNKEMRIYSTTDETAYRMPTLMHDATYREAVAWQNNHYNQPANTSFYLGAETTQVPVPEIYTIDAGGNKKTPGVYLDQAKEHVFMKIGGQKAE